MTTDININFFPSLTLTRSAITIFIKRKKKTNVTLLPLRWEKTFFPSLISKKQFRLIVFVKLKKKQQKTETPKTYNITINHLWIVWSVG